MGGAQQRRAARSRRRPAAHGCAARQVVPDPPHRALDRLAVAADRRPGADGRARPSRPALDAATLRPRSGHRDPAVSAPHAGRGPHRLRARRVAIAHRNRARGVPVLGPGRAGNRRRRPRRGVRGAGGHRAVRRNRSRRACSVLARRLAARPAHRQERTRPLPSSTGAGLVGGHAVLHRVPGRTTPGDPPRARGVLPTARGRCDSRIRPPAAARSSVAPPRDTGDGRCARAVRKGVAANRRDAANSGRRRLDFGPDPVPRRLRAARELSGDQSSQDRRGPRPRGDSSRGRTRQRHPRSRQTRRRRHGGRRDRARETAQCCGSGSSPPSTP